MKRISRPYCVLVIVAAFCGFAVPTFANHRGITKAAATPFTLLRSLWEEQGNTPDEFSLLTPIAEETMETMGAHLKKALKVKEEVSFDDQSCSSDILTTLLKAKYGSKQNEKNDFLSIQYSTSSTDFAQYMERYPNSKYASEALARQHCFEENEAWTEALASGNRTAYEAFALCCESHSTCDYDGCDVISQANHKRAEAVRTWYALTDRSYGTDPSIYADYSNYLDKYAECAVFADAARDSLSLNKDKFDWKTAKAGNDITSFKKYVEEHADGRFVWFAEDNIAQMELWQRCVETDNYMDYCTYYSLYPDGIHAFEAIEKLQDNEASDWNAAKKKHTLAAYERFVANHPNGYYTNEAQNKITEIRLAPYLKEAPSFNSISLVGYCSRPGYSMICLSNIDKNNRITISLKGPTGYSKTLAPGKHEWIRVKNGNYKILVQASKTENWWGNAQFENRMYAGAWSTYTNALFGIQKVTNKDEEALSRIKEEISQKAAEEDANTRKYILGLQ